MTGQDNTDPTTDDEQPPEQPPQSPPARPPQQVTNPKPLKTRLVPRTARLNNLVDALQQQSGMNLSDAIVWATAVHKHLGPDSSTLTVKRFVDVIARWDVIVSSADEGAEWIELITITGVPAAALCKRSGWTVADFRNALRLVSTRDQPTRAEDTYVQDDIDRACEWVVSGMQPDRALPYLRARIGLTDAIAFEEQRANGTADSNLDIKVNMMGAILNPPDDQAP